MAIYMQFGDAKGAVTESGHKEWIELLECDWSMSRTIRSAVGIGSNRESSSAYVSELTAVKFVDPASKVINNYAFVGQAKACQIDFTRTDKGQEAVFRTLTLTDAIISGLVNEGRGSERPTERLSLNFTQIAIKDNEEDADGTTGGTSTTTYDLTKAQTT